MAVGPGFWLQGPVFGCRDLLFDCKGSAAKTGPLQPKPSPCSQKPGSAAKSWALQPQTRPCSQQQNSSSQKQRVQPKTNPAAKNRPCSQNRALQPKTGPCSQNQAPAAKNLALQPKTGPYSRKPDPANPAVLGTSWLELQGEGGGAGSGCFGPSWLELQRNWCVSVVFAAIACSHRLGQNPVGDQCLEHPSPTQAHPTPHPTGKPNINETSHTHQGF